MEWGFEMFYLSLIKEATLPDNDALDLKMEIETPTRND